jgi:hypothetical protein
MSKGECSIEADENEMLPENIKEEDVPDILRGLEIIQMEAIKKISSYKRILEKVSSAKKKIFTKFQHIIFKP